MATNSTFTSYVSGYQNKDVGNVTTINVSGLSGGASYYYRVRAQNAIGAGENSNTINVGTGELPTQVSLVGPGTVNVGTVSTAFTLTSRDKNGDPVDVNQDTVFDLTSTSSAIYGFYRDSTGKLAITQVTITVGSQTTTFYYKDTASGTPTLTATHKSGMTLGAANHSITVQGGTVSGIVFDDLNGNGIQDTGEPGISGVTVKLLNSEGVVSKTDATNNDGSYRFTSVSAGIYTVEETDPAGYASTTGNRVTVSVSSNGSASANFGDQNQGTVSGTVFLDVNGSGIQDPNEPGISGVTMKLMNSEGGVSQTDITDNDGNYAFSGVSAGTYRVQETDPAGYTSTTNNIVPLSIISGGSAGANFGDKIQGTISGHVFLDINGSGIQNADEPGISGVTVKLLNSQGGVLKTDNTEANGSYGFTGVTSGAYKVQETDPAGYISTTDNTVPVSVTGSGGVTANFGDQESGTISGTVFSDINGDGIRNELEKGLGGVTVTLLVNGYMLSSTLTGGDGSYNFTGLSAGAYTIEETDPSGYGSTTDNSISVTVGSAAATASFGDIPLGTVSGVVFNDTNGNGRQDPNEKGIGGVTINLLDAQDALVETITTAGDGVYLFQNLSAGTYTVEEIYPSGYTGTTINRVTVTVGAQAAAESSVATANRGVAAANFGVLQQESVSGVVFNDTNSGGTQDSGENGVGGVLITLLDDKGSTVSGAHTAGDGTYGFYNLQPGDYDIEETYPTGYTGTTPRTVSVTVTDGGAATAGFGILQGDIPDQVTLEGPSSAALNQVSNVFTLTSKNSNGDISNVTSDTVFSLASNSTGAANFYSDAAATTVITQMTIFDGNNSASFYYKDTAPGNPTITATRTSGMNLGADTYQVTVNGSPNTQAGNIVFSNITGTGMKVAWTRGNGEKVLIVVHKGSAVDTNPVDNTAYTANATFGGGSEIGTGNFVVYKGTGTSVILTGLSAGWIYYVRAYEFNDIVDEVYNTNTAANNPNSQSTLPSAPTATAATGATGTGFAANWNVATGATGYRLDVSTETNFSSYVTGYQNKDVGNMTTASVTGLMPLTKYFYRVRAYHAGGVSENSNTISVTTTFNAPVATAATAVTEKSFTANWNVATGATGYRLDVSTETNFSSYVTGYQNKDVGNMTTASVTGLMPLTKYFYRVRAYHAGGVSGNSNTINVTTAVPIPTLNEWGMIILVMLMMGSTLFVMRRKKMED